MRNLCYYFILTCKFYNFNLKTLKLQSNCAFHAIFLIITAIYYHLMRLILLILLLQVRIDLKRQVSSYSGPSIQVVLVFIRESTYLYLTNAYKIFADLKYVVIKCLRTANNLKSFVSYEI